MKRLNLFNFKNEESYSLKKIENQNHPFELKTKSIIEPKIK